jgi:formate dehydrogenase iron-sulfur subunit
MAVCPVDCFYHTADGVVLHDKDLCIGCGYCSLACPFGAPQFPSTGAFNHRGKMDKCTFCNGGPQPDASEAEFQQYGRNRIAEGKLPLCAEMCGTKALLGGEANIIAQIYKQRVDTRGYGPELWGWDIAYAPQGQPPGKAAAPMNGGAGPGAADGNGHGTPPANAQGADNGASAPAGGLPRTQGPDGVIHDNDARGASPRPNQLPGSFQNNPRQLPT